VCYRRDGGDITEANVMESGVKGKSQPSHCGYNAQKVLLFFIEVEGKSTTQNSVLDAYVLIRDVSGIFLSLD
jgi:hypothetical protein